MAADNLHPRLTTLLVLWVPRDSPDVPAIYGICAGQFPGRGPLSEAGALPDELAARIVKEQVKPGRTVSRD